MWMHVHASVCVRGDVCGVLCVYVCEYMWTCAYEDVRTCIRAVPVLQF